MVFALVLLASGYWNVPLLRTKSSTAAAAHPCHFRPCEIASLYPTGHRGWTKHGERNCFNGSCSRSKHDRITSMVCVKYFCFLLYSFLLSEPVMLLAYLCLASLKAVFSISSVHSELKAPYSIQMLFLLQNVAMLLPPTSYLSIFRLFLLILFLFARSTTARLCYMLQTVKLRGFWRAMPLSALESVVRCLSRSA